MVARKEIAPELLGQARRLYEQTTAPVNDIMAMLDLSRSAFYRRVREEKWANRRASKTNFHFARALTTAMAAEASNAAPVVAEPASAAGPALPVPTTEPAAAPAPVPAISPASSIAPIDRAAMIERLMGLVVREMDTIDKMFDAIGPIDGGTVDRASRTLGNVGRSLHEIYQLLKPDEAAASDDTDDDDAPIDIDEFRYELARRIRALIDARRGETDGDRG